MTFQRLLLALSFYLLSTPAFSQADAARNASAADIQGYWQLLPLPDQLQPKVLPSNPWPAQCQWYYYADNGQLKSIDRLQGPCERNSRQQLEEIMREVPAVVTWRYNFSVPYQKGVLLVSRSDVKGYGEVWEPQIVVKPFTREGVEFKAGDLILYMADLQSHKMVWIRHLRKVD